MGIQTPTNIPTITTTMYSSLTLLTTSLMMVTAAPGGHYNRYKTAPPAPTKTIAELAIATPALSTLLAAVKAADLTETLSGDGPFTVFAPTDDAFASPPEELTTCLMLPENVDVLSKVLAYHAAEGYVLSTDLFDGMEIPTLEGSSSTIT